MELVDTHCHIQSIGLDKGERTTRQLWSKAAGLTPEQVLENAAQAGVTRLICVGCDLADSRLAVEFAASRDGCWASIGLHPHEAEHYADDPGALDDFAALANQPKVVAVGECGLDYYYEHSPRRQQLAVLEFQLDLAVRSGLPVVFHVREAFDDFWPVFDNFTGLRGVLHSYTDSRANLDKALERNLMVGVNGIATFTKDSAQLETYKAIPLQNLLLETDAPFLTPHPFRGSINEPKQIGVVAGFMAELRDENLQELAKATTGNARQLFGI